MTTFPIFTDSVESLPECWIYSSKRYGYYHPTVDPYEFDLPYLHAGLSSRRVLEEMGVSFEEGICEGKKVFVIIDKDHYEENEVTLPLYVFDGKDYKYSKMFTAFRPTRASIKAAYALYSIVRGKVEKEKLLRQCKDKNCIVAYNPNMIFGDFELEGISYKVLPVYNDKGTVTSTVIFNLSLITKDSVITLKVPKDKGMYIGRGGSNIRNWAREVGAKKIVVDC